MRQWSVGDEVEYLGIRMGTYRDRKFVVIASKPPVARTVRVEGQSQYSFDMNVEPDAWKLVGRSDRRAHSDTIPDPAPRIWCHRCHGQIIGGEANATVVRAQGWLCPACAHQKPVATSGGGGGSGRITIRIGGFDIPVVADSTVPQRDGMRVVYTQPVVNATFSLGPPTDPLDVAYDGVKLRELMAKDEKLRRETKHPSSLASVEAIYRRYYGDAAVNPVPFTPAQRAAISAHWSAELRAKVESAKQKEREQVVSEYEEDRP